MSSTKQKLLAGIFSLFCCHANAANIAGLSGSYVCMTNKNFAPFAANLVGSNVVGSNTLGLFNMDTMQGKIILSTTNNWGQSSPTPLQSNKVATGSFSISPGLITGSYTIKMVFSIVEGSTTFNINNSINMIPANSGNTLFISTAPNPDSAKEPENGVCQKQ